jgi:low affinity Fe/Cu permease
MNRIRRWLTLIGVSTSHPLAFAIVAVYVAAWLVSDPGSLNWQGIATVATWIMTLFIQRAENRDTLAIHAKLDELLRVEGRARNELTIMDQKEPEEIASHRTRERGSHTRNDGTPPSRAPLPVPADGGGISRHDPNWKRVAL